MAVTCVPIRLLFFLWLFVTDMSHITNPWCSSLEENAFTFVSPSYKGAMKT